MVPALFTVQRRVEFCETDAAGIAHFSAFFLYMEQAEHALLRHLGFSVVWHDGGEGTVSWPRVSAHCDYTGPVRFEQLLDITVRVARLGTKSVTYGFEFGLQNQPVAIGRLSAVCCRIIPGQRPVAIPIPEPIAARLREYVPPAANLSE